jgi:hypothetical protein
MFINNLHNDLNNYTKTIDEIKESDIISCIEKNTPIEQLECYNNLLKDINNFLSENIESFGNGDIQFKEYVTMYNFSRQHIITVNCVSNNIVLENVYYINKQWFDKDKNPLQIDVFYQDFEYAWWEYYAEHNDWDASIKDISNIPVYQEIEEEVMFLDYVYWFYSFGEFWDVIKRLLLSKTKNLPLFHLTRNRITNIQYYFDKLQFIYPTMYQKTDRSNKLFYFHKVHISLLTNIGCRGSIPKDFAYQFNKLLNPCQISEQSYNIYLARGAYGRSIQKEQEIVDVLTKKYNFIVLNGTESIEDTIYYFTNARIILGAHGSLMKNMIYCKKNPVLIELCPPTRANLDMYGNAHELGFLPFFILVDCNKNEEIILNDQQIDGLYEMLDNLI